MYSQQITFDYSKSTTDEDFTFEVINDFLDSLRRNGQTIGKYWPFYKHDRHFCSAIVMTPEQDSLNKRYAHYYVNKYIETLTTHHITFSHKILGKEPFHLPICTCKKPSAYIMYTLLTSIESPIRCADCFGTITLYKLPTFRDHDYLPLFWWQENFFYCDKISTRGTMREIANIKSSVSEHGLFCRDTLAKATKRPVYYYLYKEYARSYKQECSRKCPSCGRDWLLPEDWHNEFAFRCDYCHLVSNFAFSVSSQRYYSKGK